MNLRACFPNVTLAAAAKSLFRAGSILAIVLVWQASLSPLMSQFGSNLQYFSQVGVNGGSTTSFTVNNPSDTETITVDVQLYLPDGTPLADGQVELGPGATETLSFGDPKAALTSGWAELKSDGAFIATEFFSVVHWGPAQTAGRGTAQRGERRDPLRGIRQPAVCVRSGRQQPQLHLGNGNHHSGERQRRSGTCPRKDTHAAASPLRSGIPE